MRNILGALLFSALVLAGADVTGTWSGSFNITNSAGDTKADTAYMKLKQSGSEVTGTVGPNAEKQWAIQRGKLEGNKLTFEVAVEGGTVRFDLLLDGETIQGDAAGEGSKGERLAAKVNVKRES